MPRRARGPGEGRPVAGRSAPRRRPRAAPGPLRGRRGRAWRRGRSRPRPAAGRGRRTPRPRHRGVRGSSRGCARRVPRAGARARRRRPRPRRARSCRGRSGPLDRRAHPGRAAAASSVPVEVVSARRMPRPAAAATTSQTSPGAAGRELDDDGRVSPGARGLEGERRLAGAAGADERHEALRAQLRADRRELAVPADERGQRGGNRAGAAGGVGSAVGEPCCRPDDALRVRPVLEQIAHDPVEVEPRSPGIARPQAERLCGLVAGRRAASAVARAAATRSWNAVRSTSSRATASR